MGIPAVLVRHLTKRFPEGRTWKQALLHPFQRRWVTILEDVNLTVESGEVLGILGRNGAGKSTLAKILSTLLVPSDGSASVHGHDVVEAPHRVREVLGYCLDSERSFYYRLSGTQNLAFFATLNNLGPEKAKDRIAELLDKVGLNGSADKPFSTFSKGMRQKLALARALLTDPAVILLDEPTQNLDPAAASDCRRLVRNVLADKLGKTVIWITHSLEEAFECCTKIALLDQGRIVFHGPTSVARETILKNGFPALSSESAP
jgi:ABC-2 type transport system ATP-binding protein